MEIKETVFEMCNDSQPACFCSTDKVWINRIRKLAEKYPDEVRLVDYKPGVSICINLPKSWLKVGPPRRVNMSDEKRAEAGERLLSLRKKVDE